MRKKIKLALTAAVFAFCLLVLSGCARTMDDIIANEPRVAGTVTETSTDYIMIDVNVDDDLYDSYSGLKVPLNAENKDSMTHFSIGDKVFVYYDGNIAETAPAQINQVYAITLYERATASNQ